MKVKYMCILLILIYKVLFSKSFCQLPSEKGNKIDNLLCNSNKEEFSLFGYESKVYNVPYTTNPDVGVFKYIYNFGNYSLKNRLCDYSVFITFFPEIEPFPAIPTTGGDIEFVFNFPCTSEVMLKEILLLNQSNRVGIGFNNETGKAIVTVPRGCGSFNIYSFPTGSLLYRASYQNGTIEGTPTLSEGLFTVSGRNLFDTAINVSNNIENINIFLTATPNDNHSTVVFSIFEARFQGNWTIIVTICNMNSKTYSYQYFPTLSGMEGVLNDNGGNMTFKGTNLRPNNQVVGSFNNKTINCFETGLSTSIVCTLPTRKNSGSVGYDVPLYIKFGDKYTTNIIKISYDLPLIQSVSQQGTTTVFDVSGVYFGGVAGIKVINSTDKSNIYTTLPLRTSMPLVDIGFFIKDNNSITVNLPKNAQPGFMSLIVSNGNEASFESPRYNFKIIPTITPGQVLKSDTTGDPIVINGVFMRTVDSDGRDVPFSASGPDGLTCGSFRDGDGLSFTCALKPGFGLNNTIKVYYNVYTLIGSFVVNFAPPSITSMQQNNDGTFLLNGNNLGESVKDSIITIINSDGSRINGTVIRSAHTFAIFGYPVDGKKTASYIFELGNQVSNITGPFSVKPVIENTNPVVPCGGGMITINGHYFYNYTLDSTRVTIGKVPCNITYIDESTIKCKVLPNLKSLSPYYTSGKKLLVITSSNSVAEKIDGNKYYTYAPPTITNVSEIDQTALITIYGTSFGDANTEVLIDGKPCTQPEINIHTYSSLTCNVSNYDEMLKYNYSNTKFNISISVDGQYFIAAIFQFKYETPTVYNKKESSGFPNEMYIGIVAFAILLAMIYFGVKSEIESYIEERRARRAFRSIDNLRLQVRAKYADEIAKVYSFGNQRAKKPDRSFFYGFKKRLARLPLIKRCFKEHNE
ncbi:hypothetical protein RB653_005691 [Dictyostelium firmibasis]|uniref:IPT/TIG domain-containing protein n=1 Tax=Dictyostelium firmibasis TaxID=79012 RepID=A0AAN7U1P1_9MYCE